MIMCGATTAAVFTIGFWIKYNRRTNNKKVESIEEVSTEGDKCEDQQIDNVINDVAEETQDIVDRKSEELERIVPKEWNKIGQIRELFIYPLKSGRGKLLKDSSFTDYGISVINEEQFQLRDRYYQFLR